MHLAALVDDLTYKRKLPQCISADLWFSNICLIKVSVFPLFAVAFLSTFV